jgi:hypothetical protein
LAFDQDTLFHIDPQGRKVVTDDAGLTWRYAKRGDPSHSERYGARVAVVDASTEAEPHHFEVQPDDALFNGLVFHSDEDGPNVTGVAR